MAVYGALVTDVPHALGTLWMIAGLVLLVGGVALSEMWPGGFLYFLIPAAAYGAFLFWLIGEWFGAEGRWKGPRARRVALIVLAACVLLSLHGCIGS